MEELFELEKAVVEKIAPDVLCTKYKNGFDIDRPDAIEIDQTHHYLSKGGSVFTLVDMADTDVKLNAAAQEYFSKKARMIPKTNAVGIVLHGFNERFRAKLFLRLYKPNYPTKIFESREAAMKWFDSLRKTKTQ